MFRSRNSGSCKIGIEAPSCSARLCGLVAGEMTGDVCRLSGISSEVSKTKKASPPSPSFMEWSCLALLTLNSTWGGCSVSRAHGGKLEYGSSTLSFHMVSAGRTFQSGHGMVSMLMILIDTVNDGK